MPRASHAVAVDAADLAVVLAHVADHSMLRQMTAATAGACARLELAARRASRCSERGRPS